MSRYVSNFKSYFKNGINLPKSKIKIFYKRLSERWFRDIKFRFKLASALFAVCILT